MPPLFSIGPFPPLSTKPPHDSPSSPPIDIPLSLKNVVSEPSAHKPFLSFAGASKEDDGKIKDSNCMPLSSS